MLYQEIQTRLDAEPDPRHRRRLEQFLIEVVRGMPTLRVDQAVAVALQIDELLDIDACRDLTQVIQRAWRLPLYPMSEWRAAGYRPKSTATAVHLGVPREGPVPGPGRTEAYYLQQDMVQESGTTVATGPTYRGAGFSVLGSNRSWERRLVRDAVAGRVYADLAPELPRHCAAMLGNLWKVGAVARLSGELGAATSRQRVNPGALATTPLSPELGRGDAWYTLDLNENLGSEVFAEICLCLASILMGYSPQVWRNPYLIPVQGPLRMIECEAVGYIVSHRLGAPRRRSCTDFYLRHSDEVEGMPEEFDWSRVMVAVEVLEDLLRGDTGPVWVAAGARLRGE